jgi:hypothetical protein
VLRRDHKGKANPLELPNHGIRGRWVIDLFGLSADEVRRDFPEVYQHLLERVRYDLDPSGQPRVDKHGSKLGREWNRRESYKRNWWTFGEPRGELRPALEGLPRYIATVETAKHRVFQFLDTSILPDNMIVAIADDDAATEEITALDARRALQRRAFRRDRFFAHGPCPLIGWPPNRSGGFAGSVIVAAISGSTPSDVDFVRICTRRRRVG